MTVSEGADIVVFPEYCLQDGWECKHFTHSGLPEKRSLSLAKLAAFNVKTFPLPASPPPHIIHHGSHARSKGISSSALKAFLTAGALAQIHIIKHIIKLARKGLTPTSIGVTLHD
ncbi:hypothetical protein FIBSPDRAFT_1050803 [Athelia psychrophila]|uniref:Small ribosomal subunit protein uS15 N-terminal domain-containing protein n=1 Tax=Athelia psychrophila TaxID=1759441 RepID=A0A166A887_9AGAM|nr:hypothetical protein FIBSPDRAFT_1050803 [Fibularhizoctonia sp. CBS 109695]